MAKQGNIKLGLQFQVDKSGLNSLRTSLASLQKMTVNDLVDSSSIDVAEKKLKQINETANKVSKALEDSYNVKLNTTDLNKFQQALNNSGLTLEQIKQDFSQAGVQGEIAFRNLATEILTTNKYIKESNKLLDKMAETFSNTVRWTVASSALNSVTGSIQKAYSYTKQLDSSLNDIVIVTGKGSDEMARFAKQANNAAKALGATTTDYTKAALIYYQQGLSDTDVSARSSVTTKVANVTGQSTDAVSEQLTAIWNGYKVSAQEAEIYIDKVSAVAATTAADLEELATGMSKVASAANIMGVDIDQLNAQLATIVSVTREAPESIGTALKTVYARMSDIEAGLDTETTLGEYTKQMEALGIKALDANGDLRDMGEVVEEIGNKWNTLNRNQQTALAQIIAGTRQYSRMMALFDNWDMYESAKGTSQGSLGALQEQNDRYLDSMEAHLNKLSATAEGLYASLLDPKSLNGLIDGLTTIVGLIDQMVQGLGGGGNVLMMLGAIGMNVFDKQISRGISSAIRNAEGMLSNLKNAGAQMQMILDLENVFGDDPEFQSIIKTAEKLNDLSGLMTDDERQQSELLIKQSAELKNQEKLLNKNREVAEKVYSAISGETLAADSEKNIQTILERFGEGIDASSVDMEDLLTANEKIRAAKRGVSASKGTLTRAKKAAFADELESSTVNIGGAESEIEIDSDVDNDAIARAEANLAKRIEILESLEEAQKKNIEAFSSEMQSFSFDDEMLKTFKELDIFTEEEINDLKKAKELLSGISKDLADGKAFDAAKVEKASAAMNTYENAVKKSREAVKKSKEELEKYNKSIDKVIDAQRAADEALNKFIKSFDITKTVNGITKLASGMANIGVAANNLKNLGSIWSDETLSDGEKILQTLTNIGFAIPMLASGFSNLKQGLTDFKNLTNKITETYYNWNKAAAAKQVLDKASLEDLKSETFLKALDNALTAAGIDLDDEEIKNLREKIALGDASAATELKQILAKKAHTFATTELTVALKAAGKAAKEFLASLLANPITWIVVGVVALGAAIGGLVKQINDFNTKENRALEQMKADLTAATNATNELATAHKNLADAIDNWTSKVDAIDQMVKGTEDYRDAIFEANNSLLDLIDRYPELAEKIKDSTVHQGLLTIEAQEMEKALNAAKAKEYEAKAVEYGMRARVSEQSAKIDAANKAKDIKTGWQTTGEIASGTVIGGAGAGLGALAGFGLATGGVAAATALGATVGSAIPVIGTIIGAALGLVGGIAASIATTSTEIQEFNEQTIEKAARVAAESSEVWAKSDAELKSFFKEKLDLNDDALLNELVQNKDAIRELSETIKTADLKKDIERQQQAKNYLASLGISAYDSSQYQEQIASEIKLEDQELEEARKNAQKRTDEENHRAFAELMGYEYVSNGTGVGKFSKKNADGTYETFELNDDSIREMNAQYEALKKSSKDVHKVVSAIGKVATTGSAAVNQQLANVVTQQKVDLKSLTSAERELFASSLESLGLLTSSELAALGVSGVEIIKDFAQDAIDSIEDYRNKIRDREIKSEVYKEQFNSLFEENGILKDEDLSLQTEEYIAKIYGTQNNVLIKQFEDFLSSGILGENDLGEVLNMLPGLNSYQDIETFEKNLFGSEFSDLLSNDIFKALTNSLQKSFGLVKTYDDIAKEINLYKDIRESVTQKGDSITAEQYSELTPEMQTYFQLMADGTAILTKDAREFAKAAREAELQVVREKIKKARGAVKDYQVDIDNFTAEDKLRLDRINKLGDVPNLGILGNTGLNGNPGVWYKSLSTQSITGGITWEELIETDVGQFLQAKGYTEQDFDERYMGNMVGSANLTEFFEDTVQPLLRKEILDKVSQLKLLGISNPLIESYLDDDWNSFTFQTATAWIEETVKRAGQDGLILAGEQDAANQASGKIEGVKKEDVAGQEELAAMAQSYAEFLSFVDSGDITDESVINEWTKYWREQEKAIFRYNGELLQVENQLSNISNELDKVSQAYEEAFGSKKIALLEKQRDLLQEQKDALKDQQMFLGFQLLANKNDVINKAFNLFGDEDGSIAIDLYNKGITPELIQRALQKGREEVKENPELNDQYQAFIDALSTYQGTEDSLDQIAESLTENLRQQLENNFKNISIQFETQLDVNDLKRQYNDFVKEMTDEDDFSALTTSTIGNLQTIYSDMTTLQGELAALESKRVITQDELLEMQARGESLTEDMILETDYNNAKLEIQTQLQEKLVESKTLQKELNEFYNSQMDEINEAYELRIGYLEEINSLYDHQIKLIELIYGSESYAATKELREIQIDNQRTKLDILNQEYADYKLIANDGDRSEDERNRAREDMVKTAQKIAAAASELGQSIVDAFNDSIDEGIRNLFGKMDLVKEEWDWIKERDADALSAVSAQFEISKLQKDLDSKINNANSLNAQRQLASFRDNELRALKEKDKWTQADFDRAQARLKVLEAQIALEEAQNNKSKMRLTRRADGSYGYEYTADYDSIAEKEKDLLEAQQDLYEMDTDAIEKHFDKVLDLYDNFTEKLKEYLSDGLGLDDQEMSLLESYVEAFVSEVNNSDDLLENLKETVGNLSEDELKQMFPYLSSELYGWIKGLSTGEGSLTVDGVMDFVREVNEKGGDVTEILRQLGIDIKDITDETAGKGGIYDLFDAEQVTVISNGVTALGEMKTAVQELETSYVNIADQIWEAVQGLQQWSEILKSVTGSPTNGGASSNSEAGLSEMTMDELIAEGKKGQYSDANVRMRNGILNAYLNARDKRALALSWGMSEQTYDFYQGDPFGNGAFFNMLEDFDWESLLELFPSLDFLQFNTGGYTGSWGDSARLALLHEKELVLNQFDTKNLLNAVELVRSLTTSLEGSMGARLGELLGHCAAGISNIGGGTDLTIEQNVTIQAEFPNATDQNEIREAFNQIIGMATQKVAESHKL